LTARTAEFVLPARMTDRILLAWLKAKAVPALGGPFYHWRSHRNYLAIIGLCFEPGRKSTLGLLGRRTGFSCHFDTSWRRLLQEPAAPEVSTRLGLAPMLREAIGMIDTPSPRLYKGFLVAEACLRASEGNTRLFGTSEFVPLNLLA
jgi:hypothetical protein